MKDRPPLTVIGDFGGLEVLADLHGRVAAKDPEELYGLSPEAQEREREAAVERKVRCARQEAETAVLKALRGGVRSAPGKISEPDDAQPCEPVNGREESGHQPEAAPAGVQTPGTNEGGPDRQPAEDARAPHGGGPV